MPSLCRWPTASHSRVKTHLKARDPFANVLNQGSNGDAGVIVHKGNARESFVPRRAPFGGLFYFCFSPQVEQSARRRSFSSPKRVSCASKVNNLPTRGSPYPTRILRASFACIEPTIPGSTPRTPASPQVGAR